MTPAVDTAQKKGFQGPVTEGPVTEASFAKLTDRWRTPLASYFVIPTKTTPLALRRSKRAATVALANKLARIAWAVMAKGEAYKPLQAAHIAAQAGCA